jgi:hypothetical protein
VGMTVELTVEMTVGVENTAEMIGRQNIVVDNNYFFDWKLLFPVRTF